MIFSALPDGTHLSDCGRYRLHLQHVGFGIPLATVYVREEMHRFTGQSAMDKAQAWCREDAAKVPELHLAKTADER